ncbi:MAG: GNAT family N-acetyltransferase [Oscillospiraceae bacterium]|nr:GNAT family N-acetyltransferase [Oscillospiraceae bacterium]
MVRLEPVTEENARDVMKLEVHAEQQLFVADNRTSLREAKLALAHGGHAFPFCIYDDAVPVGFAMIGFGTDEEWEDPPAIAVGNYNIWRLMIDRDHQGKGYGRQAMKLIMGFIASEPCGSAGSCWLSYHPENTAAKHLYASFGFRETGDTDGNEVIAVRVLQK